VTFNPTATTLAPSSYLLSATATSITLPTITVSNSCKTQNVATITGVDSSKVSKLDTTTDTTKVTWSVTDENANIGHHSMAVDVTHLDEAGTKPANSKLTIPIVVSKTDCEATDIATCTGGCLLTKSASYTIGGNAAGDLAFTGFTLGSGKSHCKLDYTATAPTNLNSYLTLSGQSPNKKATLAKIASDTKAVGIYDMAWTAKSIATAKAQVGTAKQRFTIISTPCEAANGAHISVASGKASTIVWMELDESNKPEWKQNIDLKGLFSSTIDCFLTYGVAWKQSDSKNSDVRTITTITVDDAAQNFELKLKEANNNLLGVAPGWHVFTITAKSTGAVTYNPAKTVEITVKAFYKLCKVTSSAAAQVTAVAALSKKWLLNDSATATSDYTDVTTTTAICSKFLIYTSTVPSAINKGNLGVDVVTWAGNGRDANYGYKIAWNKVASDKTALIGTYDIPLVTKDWWGNTMTKTATWKYLLSNALCENKGTLTLTWSGADAATYTLGGANVDYTFSVAANVPNYCKYTVAAGTIPTTNSFNTHVTAGTGKFTLKKVEGPGSLAATYKLPAYATTLHGTKVDGANKFWEKAITIADPCTVAKLTYTATAPSNVEYQIGEADKTIMTASSQIAQGGGSNTAFCLKRVTAAYTFNPSGDASLFKNDYDSTGVLIFTKSTSVADAKSITVTVTYKLDTVAMNPTKSMNFKVTTKNVCTTPTFTIPAAQSTVPSMYEGRDSSVTFPAWTLSPTFCAHAFYIDATSNGGFGDASANFDFDGASDKRTIKFTKDKTWTSGQKKEYTIAIKAKHPTTSGTDSGKSYDFKFKIEADPCKANTPTQK